MVADDEDRPNCLGPQDLYAPHARELIGRVLEDWLGRNGVTAFELLHRPDLVERLEASGVELQHAIQKVAIPESQATGQPVARADPPLPEAGRTGDGAGSRSRSQGNRSPTWPTGRWPMWPSSWRARPDRAFVMGGVVAGALAGLRGARGRVWTG